MFTSNAGTPKRPEPIQTTSQSPISVGLFRLSPTTPTSPTNDITSAEYWEIEQKNAQRIDIERQQTEQANRLSLKKMALATKIKTYLQLKEREIDMTAQLSAINRAHEQLSALSLDDLELQLKNKTTELSEQEQANSLLIQQIKVTKKTRKLAVSEGVHCREKELIVTFKQEYNETTSALHTVKQQLAHELRLSKQLALDESALQTQLTTTVDEEERITNSLNASASQLEGLKASLGIEICFSVATAVLSPDLARTPKKSTASNTDTFFKPATHELKATKDAINLYTGARL